MAVIRSPCSQKERILGHVNKYVDFRFPKGGAGRGVFPVSFRTDLAVISPGLSWGRWELGLLFPVVHS